MHILLQNASAGNNFSHILQTMFDVFCEERFSQENLKRKIFSIN